MFRREALNCPRLDGEPFRVIETLPFSSEKDVQRVLIGDHFYARKIYRLKTGLVDQKEQEKLANWEYESLKYLSNTRFNVHVPKVIDTVKEAGHAAGLLCEWREGEQLSYSTGKPKVTLKAIKQLDNNLQWLKKRGQYIWTDDFSSLFWDGTELWFAECRLSALNLEPPITMHKINWYPDLYTQTIESLIRVFAD